jgi:hypothetical protein
MNDASNIKPTCKSFGEYVQATTYATSHSAVDYVDFVLKLNNSLSEDLQRCFSGCPNRFCQTWNYRIDKNIVQHAPYWNLSKLSGPSQETKMSFYVKERKLKVIEEQVVIGLNQLIGEIGGTWGFYLGFSPFNALFAFGDIITKLIGIIRLPFRNRYGNNN